MSPRRRFRKAPFERYRHTGSCSRGSLTRRVDGYSKAADKLAKGSRGSLGDTTLNRKCGVKLRAEGSLSPIFFDFEFSVAENL